MSSRARLLGHPLHQVLIVFPLGLLGTSFFFDLAYLVHESPKLGIASSWMIAAGVIGGAIAALFGTLDWMSIPKEARARRVGAWHGGGNAIVALLFAASWVVRRDQPGRPEGVAIALSALGVLLCVLTGWLGSKLADHFEEES
ncbi:MAG TPA: DUF2231 domain-containing protein [Thermoanaerobaculia bacterium]|nr:DUF2231 domain-containing protein [Thermoanaerobaculia bacterium]